MKRQLGWEFDPFDPFVWDYRYFGFDPIVAQVLYRLGLVEQLRGKTGGRVVAFSFERASAMAEQLEAASQEPLEFSCTIMVLGKTGVGKSATINSIFDEVKFRTDAFQLGTKKVQDVVGTVQGIKVRVIDTPGLLPFWADQRKNQKILQSVKKFIQKSPPDIVLYLDRLDMLSRDDMPILRTITDIFGQSIWFNAIVVLTHAASAPPEGPNGTATSYDMFVTQRSHVVQQAIRQAAGDMRLMNPVSLVENHSACRTNQNGQRVLPNGQVWKPHLLLLSFASKILVEANMLLKLQDSPPGKPFAARSRTPPLPYILKEQKKSYYDELEYREKLFMKKQLKEEKKRRKMMKKMAEAAKIFPTELTDNNVEEDSNAAATVPVAVQD
ncbi:translocase of chloroplast 120, chloroplastic-like protein [Tanacetum coccineum]